MKTQLTTERLILRPWCEADAQYLFQYASDSQIGPAAGWPVHTSVENSRQIIKDVLSAPETYAVCLKTDGIPIGSVGLKTGENTDMTDRTDECELGYWIGKPFWGQGLIPEAARELLRHAFEDLNMRAVWCGYYDGNTKSRRVQDKLGFQYHHTTEGLEVTLLNEIRTGHTMLMTKQQWIMNMLKERFSTDSLISIATVDYCGVPWVRTVDAIYTDGAFYTITNNTTNKMKHINNNPLVAICGEWFSGHGKAESLGYICNEENKDLADNLRAAFASWYDNGHTNENDVNTIVLKITVTDGIIYKDGKRFEF